MKNFLRKSYSKSLVFVLRACGLCSACFLIEACYGAPQGQYDGTRIVDFEGKIKTSTIDNNAEIIITNNLNKDTIKTFSDNNGFYKIQAEITPVANYSITATIKNTNSIKKDIIIDKNSLESNKIQQDIIF